MSLAEFNKDNPLVIKMRKMEDQLSKDMMVLTKVYLIVMIITMLIAIPTMIITKNVSLIITAVYTVIESIRLFRGLIKKSQLRTVNDIIYGDEFSGRYVNDEKIFDVLELMNQAQGRLSGIRIEFSTTAGLVVVLSIVSLIMYFI